LRIHLSHDLPCRSNPSPSTSRKPTSWPRTSFDNRWLPIPIWFRHSERIRQMPDLSHFAVAQQHLHDIKPYLSPRGCFSSFSNPAPSATQSRFWCIHRRRRPLSRLPTTASSPPRTPGNPVAKHQVNLSPVRPEIRRQKFQPSRRDASARRRSPNSPRTSVQRLLPASPQCLDAFPKVHPHLAY